MRESELLCLGVGVVFGRPATSPSETLEDKVGDSELGVGVAFGCPAALLSDALEDKVRDSKLGVGVAFGCPVTLLSETLDVRESTLNKTLCFLGLMFTSSGSVVLLGSCNGNTLWMW